MPLVEIGAGIIEPVVIGVEEVATGIVRGVVKRVAPGVGQICAQPSDVAVQGKLQRVVAEFRQFRDTSNTPLSGEGAVRFGFAAAGARELGGGRTRGRYAV